MNGLSDGDLGRAFHLGCPGDTDEVVAQRVDFGMIAWFRFQVATENPESVF